MYASGLAEGSMSAVIVEEVQSSKEMNVGDVELELC